MNGIEDWIDLKLAEIAIRLPTIVHSDPASFSCGYNAGYKACLLDLDTIVTDNRDVDSDTCP